MPYTTHHDPRRNVYVVIDPTGIATPLFSQHAHQAGDMAAALSLAASQRKSIEDAARQGVVTDVPWDETELD